MQEQAISFSYRARYFVSGNLSNASQVWFVLHGYGQLAGFFIRKFDCLPDLGIAVVAPEGLSRFYLEDVTTRSRGGSQRVGASWMTRENRQMDIENYLHYLDAVYQSAGIPGHAEVTFLGFSQGAATATRWAVQTPERFDRLILWAGLLPHDLPLPEARTKLATKHIVHVYGTQDPFLSDERFQDMKNMAESVHDRARFVSFEGGHEIDTATLRQLATA